MGSIVKGIGDAVSAPLNSLGNLTGLHIGTGGVNWSTPNPNLGDIWNVASAFSPAGHFTNLAGLGTSNFGMSNLLGPLANIGKSNAGDWMNFLGKGQQGQQGMMGGGRGYTMPGGNLSNADMIGSMLGSVYGPSMMEGQYNQGATMRRLQSLDRAYQALDPSNFMASIDQYGRTATAGAQQNAKRFANANPSASSSTVEGANLDALNQGNMATNQYAQNLLNPFQMAQAYQGQSSLLSPQNTMQNYAQLMSLLGLNNQQAQADLYAQANRPPTTFENFAQYLGGPIEQWAQRQIFGSGGQGDPQYRYLDADPGYADLTQDPPPLDWRSFANIALGLS